MEKEYRKYVFDASALICLSKKEEGFDKIKKYLPNALISSVNIAEFYKHCLSRQDLTIEDAKRLVTISGVEVINFNHEQAIISSEIYKDCKQYGLSLADRSCLALGISTGYPVVTCDRAWSNLNLDIKVIQVR